MSSRKNENEPPAGDLVTSDLMTFDEEMGTYRMEFDGHVRPPTEAVTYAVAEASQTDPLDLPPLLSVLDSDALTALFDTSTNSQSQTKITVSFEFADHHVVLKGNGIIVITPPSAEKR
jgi:hypothetical protein